MPASDLDIGGWHQYRWEETYPGDPVYLPLWEEQPFGSFICNSVPCSTSVHLLHTLLNCLTSLPCHTNAYSSDLDQGLHSKTSWAEKGNHKKLLSPGTPLVRDSWRQKLPSIVPLSSLLAEMSFWWTNCSSVMGLGKVRTGYYEGSPTYHCLSVLLFLLHNLGLTFSSKKGKWHIKEQNLSLRKYGYTLVYWGLLFLGQVFDSLCTIEHGPIVYLIWKTYMKHITITSSKCTILLTDVAKLHMLKWNILFDYRKKRS